MMASRSGVEVDRARQGWSAQLQPRPGREVREPLVRQSVGASVRAGEVAFKGGEAITDDYPGAMPWIFTGGTIKRVAVDISGEPCVDLEREAVAMLSRE